MRAPPFFVLVAAMSSVVVATHRHPIHDMLPNLVAIDGDTFKDSNRHHRHYRFVKIDAPELPGHCRKGRVCVAGDPYAAKRALQAILDQGGIKCRDQGIDVYRRQLVDCFDKSGADIGDELLASGVVSLYHRPVKP